jgi:uncharacterized protein YbdZ (MbtH family)
LLACASCGGQAWSTHTDPRGFRVEIPAGWQVTGDARTGRVLVSGPARQQVIIWPVFVPGAVEARMAPALLQQLTSAAKVDAQWKPPVAPSAKIIRMQGTMGDRTMVSSFAWIGSGRGAAGFLYVAGAPTATYHAEMPTLGRILASFRASGNPARGDAEDGKWVAWQDPREQAFRLEVPAGWTVTGGAFRFASVDIRKVIEASSPDGSIRITGGDAELPPFTEPTPVLAMAGFREGSWYSPGFGVNMLVRRYTPGTQFAREYVATRAARGCARLVFTGSRDRADVDAPLNRLMSGLAAAGGIMQIQSGEVTFTCEREGRPAAGYYFAGSLRAGAAGMPGAIWHIEYLYGYLATREKTADAERIISHMLATYQDNPQWMAMQQNVTAATSRIVTETQQHVSKMISDTFTSKNQVDDEISRRRENATLGTVDVIDPASGREFKVENSSNYFWLDHRGFIVGTQTDTTPGWNFQQLVALP